MRLNSKMLVLVVAALLLCGVASSSACLEFCTCENGEVQCRNARLTSIPEGLGDDTVVLDVSYNNITIISSKDFESMPKLNKIIVSDSGVEKILPETFNGVQQLEVLDLHGNTIRSLHPSLFQYNLNLVTLDLSDNLLVTFECDLNLKLKFLNFSVNQLTSDSIPNFLEFTSLETLDLSHNQISNLSGAIINALDMLTHLDISGNQLEYDCDLKTLWTLCTNRNINCVNDDERSWKMLENLNCGDDEVTEEDAITPEAEFIVGVGNSVVNSEIVSNDDEEGSGIGVTVTSDPTLLDSTENITDEPAIMEEGNWIMIVSIVCAVIVVVLVVIVIIICIVRRRKSSAETTTNISHAHSIQYLNQHDEFNPSYKNSVKKTDSSKVRNNNFDRVLNPRDYSKSESNSEIIALGDYASAEIVRVPSFKSQGVATPLNLPEEVSYPSQSLPRSSPASSYEDNTLRVSSLRRYAKPEQGTVPDIQMIPPVRRVSSNKRR